MKVDVNLLAEQQDLLIQMLDHFSRLYIVDTLSGLENLLSQIIFELDNNGRAELEV